MSEVDLIAERYSRRLQRGASRVDSGFSSFQYFSASEREFWFRRELYRLLGPASDLKALEIGAGAGFNIGFFRRMGVNPENIWGNELLPDRIAELKKWLPENQIIAGDARAINMPGQFDVILQSTVFSSILDKSFCQELANSMWSNLKPGGVILWYDFTYGNPKNKDVRGISWGEAKSYWPDGKVQFHKKVTLAPPIARRVGRLYNFINFPFLRTHVIGMIQK